MPSEYFLARYVNDIYTFDHKFTLLTDPASGETSFQVLTKDAQGEFTEALPENRFSIENRFVKITLIDIFGDGSQYKIRLATATLTKAANRILLGSAQRPGFVIAEGLYSDGTTPVSVLNFIGSIDIRAGFTSHARVVFPPGQDIEISAASGDLIFQY